MSERILEEWGRQRLDSQYFEPPYDPGAYMPKHMDQYLLTNDASDRIDQSPESAYIVLRTSEGGEEYGDEITFTDWLKKAHSDADWAATMGRKAIVVESKGMTVVYDTQEND
jgi:hypothetical protein